MRSKAPLSACALRQNALGARLQTVFPARNLKGGRKELLVTDVLGRPAPRGQREHDKAERHHHQPDEFESKSVQRKGVHSNLSSDRSLDLSGVD